MRKGIVMEITSKHLIVLTPQGDFLKIPRSGRICQVGEEISFRTAGFRRRSVFTIASAMTAAVVFCVILFAGLGGRVADANPVVAYVTVDINPSVELGIDSANVVREARGLDEDGSELLRSITLTGQPLETATVTIIEAIEQKGYLDAERNEVIISSTKAFEEAEVDESAIGETVKLTVARTIEEKRPKAAESIQVAAIVTPPAVREEAMAKGLSAGKYAIYLSAKNSGNEIDLEQLKKGTVREAAEQAGSLGGLFNMEDLAKKEALVKLLEAEKRGELDEKVKKAKQLAKDNKPVAVSNDNESPGHKGNEPDDDGPKGRNKGDQGKNGDNEKKGDNRNKNDNENRGDNETHRNNGNGNNEKNGNGGELNGNKPKQESKEDRSDTKNAANRGNNGNNGNSGDKGPNGNSGNRENFGNASSSAAGNKSDWNDGRAILSGLKINSDSEKEKGQKNGKDQNQVDGGANKGPTSASRGIDDAGLISAREPNGDKPDNGEKGNRNKDRRDKNQDNKNHNEKNDNEKEQNGKSKKDNGHRDENSKTGNGKGQNGNGGIVDGGQNGNAGNMKGASSGKGNAFGQ
jgi:hypothetical protein